MLKILLLIENEQLAQMYKTNLSVYLEAQVTRYSSYKEYFNNIDRVTDYSLIVAQSNFNNVDMAKELETLFKESRVFIPSIVIGSSIKVSEGIISIKDYFDIPLFMSSAAKALSVTPQMMANYIVPEYYPIDIEFIFYLKKAPTNLYIVLGSEFVLFANKGTNIEKMALDLKSEGISKFYVKSIERLEIIAIITEILKNDLIQSRSLSSIEKVEILSNGFDFFVNNFLSPQAAQSIINTANNCVKIMSEFSSESPDLNSLFLIFKSIKDSYFYMHIMLGAYVSSHIVRNLSWGGDTQIDKLNFSFFFHDIYLAPLFFKYPNLHKENDLMNSPELNRQEKLTVANHARLAADLIGGFKDCPVGCDVLVKQHHGVTTGVGFADEFKDDITPLAKIIIVSESFVEFLIEHKGKSPQAQFDMVNAIQFLNEKFKKNSYKKIIETLLNLKI